MRFLPLFLLFRLFVCPHVEAAPASGPFRLIRSISGPSGKVVQSKFVLDEIRHRFVYPQDNSLVVYFEWEAPAGNHALTGSWKGPDGRTVSISPDVKIETQTSELNAYWVFQFAPPMASGVWSLEVSIDGEPAGSQSFELVIPEQPKPKVDDSVATPSAPTLNEIYKSVLPSMVWIYRLDASGRRTDTASGFVIGPNNVATAFQVVDSSAHLEIVFENGRQAKTDELWQCNRLQDWALIKVDTGDVPPLTRGNSEAVSVGERLIVFNVETGLSRVIGGVDIGAKRTVPGFGQRIQISPALGAEAAGGPLLDSFGKVVGIIGGNLTPGARFQRRDMSLSPGLWSSLDLRDAATPIAAVPKVPPPQPVSLEKLAADGTFTPAIVAKLSFLYGGSTAVPIQKPNGLAPKDTGEFSRKDANVWVYTVWEKKDKIGKGVISAKVYDAHNLLRVTSTPKKVTLSTAPPVWVTFGFPPDQFETGVYRVDVLWDDHPAWRTFFRIVD